MLCNEVFKNYGRVPKPLLMSFLTRYFEINFKNVESFYFSLKLPFRLKPADFEEGRGSGFCHF
jgi:hypothetical protein